jgi:Protein of unknown function (DUF1592)/Protein of unknown function (DUF1588)/Protein of unknown function (DUF1595)/Protein of unknown function (DUF1587)/Protein of unknown function (DUF1585)
VRTGHQAFTALGLACCALSCQGLVGGFNGQSPSSEAPSTGAPNAPGQPVDPNAPPSLPETGAPCVADDVTLRRLTNAEINQSVASLFGVSQPFANQLPQRTSQGVFDNNRRVQSLDVSTVTKFLFEVVEPLVDAVLEQEQKSQAKRVLTCELTSPQCLKSIVTKVGLRVWRRPLTDAEVSEVEAVAAATIAAGEPALEGLRWALVTLLVSPNFWFRQEGGPTPQAALDPFALAARLSFFAWGEAPDEALLQSAASGALLTPQGFEAQVSRLLSDTKASRTFTQSLAGQWLGLTTAAPPVLDVNRYRSYMEASNSLRGETEGMLRHVFESGAPLTDLVDAHYSVGDDKIRGYYQVGGGGGSSFNKFDIPNGRAAGLLTHPLLAASNHGVANPIFRGAYTLKRFMCVELSVPQNVPALPAESVDSTLPVAEQLKKHRTSPACASCHNSIDPVGLAMENLDAAAQPRTTYDNGKPVDATAVLPNGQMVTGVRGLGESLKNSDEFVSCATARVAAFAYGVPLEAFDAQQLKVLRVGAGAGAATASSLLRTVMLDASFQTVCGAQRK